MISTLADDNQSYLASPRVGGAAAEEPREITGFTNFGQGPSFSFPDFHIDGKKIILYVLLIALADVFIAIT